MGFVLITVVFAVMGGGLILPVLPSLVKQFAGGDFAGASHTYGWLNLVFALAQFLGAPILGSLSDRYGRRRVILITTAGAAADYVILALAPSLGWLFVGRGLAGLTAGIIATANAYLVDVTPAEHRPRQFGLIGAAFGVGFVIGPMAGGLLGGLDLRLPFWVAAGLAATNFLYGWFVLPESLLPEQRRPFAWRRANPVGALLALRHLPVVVGLALSHLIFWIAQAMLHSTWVLYTDYRYQWTPAQVGLSLCLAGACSIVVQTVLVRRAIAALGEERGLLAGFSITLCAFLAYGLAPSGTVVLVVIVLASVGAIAGPSLQSCLSRQVSAREQGSVQGAFIALTSVGTIVGQPLAAWSFGWAVGPDSPLPVPGIAFFEAALLMAACLAVARWTFRRARALPA